MCLAWCCRQPAGRAQTGYATDAKKSHEFILLCIIQCVYCVIMYSNDFYRSAWLLQGWYRSKPTDPPDVKRSNAEDMAKHGPPLLVSPRRCGTPCET